MRVRESFWACDGPLALLLAALVAGLAGIVAWAR
jgi:hypothetical protein